MSRECSPQFPLNVLDTFSFNLLQGVSRECSRHEGDQEMLVQAPGKGTLRLLQLWQEKTDDPQWVSYL
jgi:hypothetical protein